MLSLLAWSLHQYISGLDKLHTACINSMENRLLDSKILIVDDKPASVLLLERILKQENFLNLISTTDSRKVLDLYKKHKPDLVLLDLLMPYLNGFQIMEQLKYFDRNSYAPILVLTSQNEKDIIVRAWEAGANDFIEKPFNATEVICRIKNLLEVRLLHNRIIDQNMNLEKKIEERTKNLYLTNLNLENEIIQRKKTQKNLKGYVSEVERTNQELNEFIFIASHDFQEPIRKIIIFGDILKSNLDEPQKIKLADVDRILKATFTLKSLFDDLREHYIYMNIDPQYESVNISNLITEILSDFENFSKNIKVRVVFQEMPVIESDHKMIKKLFINLISNGLKFHKEDKVSEVEITCKCLDEQVLEFTFQDNGIGFDQKFHDQIFKPFKRLVNKSKFEGNGIGLSTCKKIVKRLGGTITARSKPGEGASFFVRLPKANNGFTNLGD